MGCTASDCSEFYGMVSPQPPVAFPPPNSPDAVLQLGCRSSSEHHASSSGGSAGNANPTTPTPIPVGRVLESLQRESENPQNAEMLGLELNSISNESATCSTNSLATAEDQRTPTETYPSCQMSPAFELHSSPVSALSTTEENPAARSGAVSLSDEGSCFVPTKLRFSSILSTKGSGKIHSAELVILAPADSLQREKGEHSVVRAFVRSTGKQCVLKTMLFVHPSQLAEVSKDLTSLRACIDHHKEMGRYIVDVYGAFLISGQLRVALEQMEGSLGLLLEKNVFIPEEILATMVKPVLTGLEYLHRHLRLVHLGIKPSNILFNYDGCVKISDFGTATALDAPAARSGHLAEAMVYMSPERLEGEPYGFSADIWSVGIVALELAQRFPPYDLQKSPSPNEQHSVCDTQIHGVRGCHEASRKILKHLHTVGPPKLPTYEDAEAPLESSCVGSPPFVAFSTDLCLFLTECLRIDKAFRPNARQLLSRDWIVRLTLSEESLDEARFQNWLFAIF